MLCLDTSLKAIHNYGSWSILWRDDVYAMLRYKFESNSQREVHEVASGVECICYVRYKFESNSQREDVLAVGVENVYAMFRYKFESNSGSQRTQLQMYE